MPGRSLVIFDLDGTLIDSRKDLADAANATLRHYGYPPLEDDRVARMVGEGARLLVQRAFAAHGADAPPDALDVFLARYDERLWAHTRTYPDVAEVVAALAARARLAVLTNKPQRPSERLLEHFDLARHFAHVIGGDSRFPRKPEPASVQWLMAEEGTDGSGTVLVGDSWIDHETTIRAGIGCVLVRYGFGFAQIPADRFGRGEVIVERARDLLERLPQRLPGEAV